MKKWIIRIVVVLVIVAAAVIIKNIYFAPKPIPVEVFRVENGRVEETVTNSRAGTVKARQRAKLSPETSGTVAELPYEKGDIVEAGEVLIRLDNASQKAQLELARRSLSTAEALEDQAAATAARAKSELARYRRLSDDDLVSKDLLEGFESAQQSAEAAYQAALAEVQRAKSAVHVAETELKKTVLKSPFAGVIADQTTEVGEWISPAPPMMLVPAVIDLIDPSSIYISAPMDEVDSARLKTGQPVRVTVDPLPGERFPGKIVRVAPFVLDIEQQNRTVEIEVELEDADLASQLLPGTSADVEVILTVREPVLRIPAWTLLEGEKVLVVEAGRLVDKKVSTGIKNWDFVEITDGLGEGDPVVTSLDSAEIQAGAQVSIEDGDAGP
jgi:HlyD family secretion protein